MRSERSATNVSIRNRTTKLIARRHDLNYFKTMSPIRRWQWVLALVALGCAVVWFASSTIAQGNSSFSSGPISSSHAVFGQKCELCHIPAVAATGFTPAFGFRKKVPDSACLSCHVATAHFPMQAKETPTCASCHTEHVGATHLASTADRGCTDCHANLQTRSGVLNVSAHVGSFAKEHPEFRPLRLISDKERAANFALKFNHAEHMHPGLAGPKGPENLACQSCHQAAINDMGRQQAHIAPVDFEKSCRSCHQLDFDKHITQEAPHSTAAEAQAFVVKSINDFAQAHPDVVAGEIRNWTPDPLLPGQVRMPAPKTTAEWIAYRVTRSEIILWREKCGLCHRDLNRTGETTTQPVLMPASFTPGSGLPTAMPTAITELAATPEIEPAKQQIHWYRAAVFSHPAHQAVECIECHGGALTSTSNADILMPSIATCRKCHDGESSPQGPPVKTGHAESGCFLCHVYHGDQTGELASKHNIAQLTSK
jgi:hypothetical protein